ncbi:MAG: alanine racemase [Bacteroidia bacterium]
MANLTKNLTAPTLLLNTKTVEQNVKRMKKKCSSNGLKLFPHFKTHQSASVGKLIANEGIDGITVSSLKMAQYFADNGFSRIHLAMPPIKSQNHLIASLCQKTQLSINVSCKNHLHALDGVKVNVVIDIDPEYGRTGIDINQPERVKSLVLEIEKQTNLTFGGLYIHNGATYNGWIEILQLHEEVIEKITHLKSELGLNCNVFFGDTPGCSVAQNFNGITHITAGNFVFNDLMQVGFDSCFESAIAVCMACPIIEIHSTNQQLVIHGGAVHFSKDSMLNHKGQTIYGKMVHLNENGWSHSLSNCELISISQEHGILNVTKPVFEQYNIGDCIGVLPVHSCLTANCMQQFVSFDGRTYNALPK